MAAGSNAALLSAILQAQAGQVAQGQLQAGADRSIGALGTQYPIARGDISTGATQGLGALGEGFTSAQGALAGGRDLSLEALRGGYDTARGDLTGQYGTAREDIGAGISGFDPYARAGVSASDARLQALGLAPNAGGGAYGGFQQSPGYRFRVDQALDQINRRGAVGGDGLSGNILAALSDRAGGLAAQDFQQYLDNLTGVSNAGQQAAGSQLQGREARGQISATLGNRLGDLASEYGRGQANAYDAYGTRGADLASNYGANRAGIYGTQGQNLAGLATGFGTNQAGVYTGLGTNQANLGLQTAQGITKSLGQYGASQDAIDAQKPRFGDYLGSAIGIGSKLALAPTTGGGSLVGKLF